MTPFIGFAAECIFEYGAADWSSGRPSRDGLDFNFDAGLTAVIDSVSPKTGGSMGGTLITISQVLISSKIFLTIINKPITVLRP